ncbi:hypothetical protein SAMN05444274_103372 [Mariniphaga anaerophila]|uniref:Uncharacterized protein n=1 Tax=Mariniphaga anaerophila TaxID=1484053 RepID=A0A1M4YJ84_9BACT|nr:hypothetical protein [Mariniphaga anaerophila]SHF05797.1 hypothetical protein SAMN05444274_103372 [Mariniphaga anaerophila]
MQPEKKQLEVLLMHYFRNCYPEFPKGKTLPSESPDFIVTLKSKNHLGIELTRLNPANAKEPDEVAIARNRTRERIIESARELFEGTSPLKLFVKFLFSETEPISEERELAVSVQLTNVVRKAIVGKKTGSFFKELVGPEALPAGLEALLIVHHPGLQVSFWERSNNLGVSENVVADIREAIHKKDEKLRYYQKQRLNYYWLLVTTDRLRGVKSYNLPNKIMNLTFHSRFQHVFLFDLIKADVFQLV